MQQQQKKKTPNYEQAVCSRTLLYSLRSKHLRADRAWTTILRNGYKMTPLPWRRPEFMKLKHLFLSLLQFDIFFWTGTRFFCTSQKTILVPQSRQSNKGFLVSLLWLNKRQNVSATAVPKVPLLVLVKSCLLVQQFQESVQDKKCHDDKSTGLNKWRKWDTILIDAGCLLPPHPFFPTSWSSKKLGGEGRNV